MDGLEMVVAELKMIQMFTGTERGWTGLEMSPSERQLRVREAYLI